MQVKQIAELTGTTVRTVRHYHAIGLLPVPDVRHGRRDYQLVHVARLTRIRWLVESGVPLAQVAQVLTGEDAGRPSGPDDGARASALADLRSSLAALDERLADLAHRRERLVRLILAVEAGGAFSPLSAVAIGFYDQLEAAATDEATRRALRAERDFVELASFRGELPPEAELLFTGVTDEGTAEMLAAFRAGSASDRVLTDEEVEVIAASNVARIKERMGERLPQLLNGLGVQTLNRLYALFDATADSRAGRIGRAMERLLLTEIEETRR